MAVVTNRVARSNSKASLRTSEGREPEVSVTGPESRTSEPPGRAHSLPPPASGGHSHIAPVPASVFSFPPALRESGSPGLSFGRTRVRTQDRRENPGGSVLLTILMATISADTLLFHRFQRLGSDMWGRGNFQPSTPHLPLRVLLRPQRGHDGIAPNVGRAQLLLSLGC